MGMMTASQLMSGVDSIASQILSQTYPVLAAKVSPIVYSVGTLYWVWFGYMVWEGYATFSTLLKRVIVTILIFGSLHWGGWAGIIYGLFSGLMDQVGDIIFTGGSTLTVLDKTMNYLGGVASSLMSLRLDQLGMLVLGVFLLIVDVIYFVVAIGYMLLAKVGLAITMIFLPLIVAFFFFDQTKAWGSNWINAMLNYVYLYIVVVAIVRFGDAAWGAVYMGNIPSVDEAANGNIPMLSVTDVTNLIVITLLQVFFLIGARAKAAQLSNGTSAGSSGLIVLLRSAARGFGGRK